MSITELPQEVAVREKQKKTVDCPPEIGEQLKRTAFDQISANVYEKTRTPFGDDDEYKVVTAEVDGDQLHISAEDIVGVVNLTPSCKLQITPKIGWNEILEMFFLVNKYNRSFEYHGIPIDDFLSNDIGIEDIFIVIAVNYLRSLDPIHRQGFVREFQTSRVNAVNARGRIDVEKSMDNLVRGVPKQHYVQKDINYSTRENSLILCAGQVLLTLFQQKASDDAHDEYYRVFSEVREEVNRLTEMGIRSGNKTLSEFKRVTVRDLPRQRGYYSDAISVSKMILSSSTGESLESGQEELTMDFIIDMESLFEEFTQIVLEEELEELRSNLLIGGLDGVRVEDEPVYYPYEETEGAHYRPDHVLKNESETVAVLDSKYFDSSNDPSMNADVRNRMLSYAYVLDSDRMAFLCPFGSSLQRTIRDREATVEVLRPEGEFSIKGYRQSVSQYLRRVLDGNIEESQLVNDIRSKRVCHSQIHTSDPREVIESDELRVDESTAGLFAQQVVNKGAAGLSSGIRYPLRARESRKKANRMRKKVKSVVKRVSEDYDVCVPIFHSAEEGVHVNDVHPESDWDGDTLRLDFLSIESGSVTEVHSIGPLPLDWEGDLSDDVLLGENEN